jgi:1-acyl-sn-glycerol-3-phosphate acyltransferase
MSLDAIKRFFPGFAGRLTTPELPRPDERNGVEVLTQVCVEDLLSAFGLGEVRRGRRALELASRIPARRFAREAAAYDEIVGEQGLAAGGEWALGRMSRNARIVGRENVPEEGPLLIVANHPGLADTLALFAAMPRDDLRVVAAERPFLSALPNTSRHLLTVRESSPERTALIRAARRHLKSGGAVLTFPGGRIEPDPDTLPGAAESLESWSSSVDLFARLASGLTIVPALVSGVISPAALGNPITLVRRRPEDRRWLAATLQMLWPRLRDVTTRVEFGRRIHTVEGEPVRAAVRAEMRRMIQARAGEAG